ncbi:hypothetical protein CCOS865_01277 [Pseudomonas reidholzensis]|uniref:DUF7832 domain-containing protein n=1 Tax=Pseudomonas reidholzensis TaxID=1785162 RepID=A0A383RPN5_9PSED|nr:hypothetical protein [Pseudomonas reidholzensis]SYX89037.1 hypothetical protein CCOS865_01277 [Pseudomonas reidholzensis]
MKYDDASWHYGNDFPAGQPQENGGTHIALFLRWCFIKGWAGEFYIEEEPEALARVISGELSATEFLFSYCDGKLTDDDLSDEGNVFAQQYYGKDGLYLQDYADHFQSLMYVAPESAHDFDTFCAMLDARFESGILVTTQL